MVFSGGGGPCRVPEPGASRSKRLLELDGKETVDGVVSWGTEPSVDYAGFGLLLNKITVTTDHH